MMQDIQELITLEAQLAAEKVELDTALDMIARGGEGIVAQARVFEASRGGSVPSVPISLEEAAVYFESRQVVVTAELGRIRGVLEKVNNIARRHLGRGE